MNRADVLRMAREAGFQTGTRDLADGNGGMPFVQSVATGNFLVELERFAALAVEHERSARIAAQVENEALKTERVKYGLAHRKAVQDAVREAVLAEREACEADAARYRWLRDTSVPPHNFYLSVPDEFHGVQYESHEVDSYIDAAIRARGAA